MAGDDGTTGISVIDVLDRVLDKGIVIDAAVRVSVVGIELLGVDARVVVASIETYLRHADALAYTAMAARPQPQPAEPPLFAEPVVGAIEPPADAPQITAEPVEPELPEPVAEPVAAELPEPAAPETLADAAAPEILVQPATPTDESADADARRNDSADRSGDPPGTGP